MSTPAIESALKEMQSLAAQAGAERGGGSRVAARVGGGGFADELYASLARINQLHQASGETAKAFQRGDPGVALHDVMVDMQKAGVAFEMGVQVRNRLITAYKDIMNMQI